MGSQIGSGDRGGDFAGFSYRRWRGRWGVKRGGESEVEISLGLAIGNGWGDGESGMDISLRVRWGGGKLNTDWLVLAVKVNAKLKLFIKYNMKS